MDSKKRNKNLEKGLVMTWLTRSSVAAESHYAASSRYHFIHVVFTTVNIISSIAVLYFSNISETQFLNVMSLTFGAGILTIKSNFLVSLAGLIVVLTTTLQYVFHFNDKSRIHKVFGNEYANMKRKLERLITEGELDPDALHRVSTTLNLLAKGSPHISQVFWWYYKKSFSMYHGEASKSFYEILGYKPKMSLFERIRGWFK